MSQPNHTVLRLKRSYELHELHINGRGRCEVVDSASNGKSVFVGTYRQCVAYCKKIGVWFS